MAGCPRRRSPPKRASKLYVNGTIDPTAKIRPGQLQRWRIFNADADRFVVLRLARTASASSCSPGRPHARRARRTSATLMIAPGSRRDVLVRGGRPGSYPLKAVPFAQFPGGDKAADGGPVPNETLLTLRSAGPRTHMRLPTRTAEPARSTCAVMPRRPRTHDRLQRNGRTVGDATVPAERHVLRPEPYRRDDEARLGRALDAGQLDRRMAHVPHPHE